MNRNRHRVVFNAARGLRMVVAECARSIGPGTSSVGLSATALLLALLAPAAWSQIVADPAAPGNQRPTILGTGNGVPLVNITTPSAAGVSLNQYNRFDVGAPGAILNNSRTPTNSQLGGPLPGNPWLATGSARVIVNQVNSNNPSFLNGPIEVAGQRAEVVIANPSGIQVNGAGFINASGVTLTTGTPVFKGGSLDSYIVQRGNVGIFGAGLDARGADYLSILSRATEVNADLWAKHLRVVNGANTVDAATHQPTGAATPIGEPPRFLLDVAHLGGMYAGHIFLVGTDKGLGVNLGGTLAAQQQMELLSDGRLVVKGTVQSGGELKLKAAGIDNAAGAQIVGQQGVSLSTPGELANAGLIDGAQTSVQAGVVHNSGRLYGDQLAITADSVVNAENAVIAAREHLDVQAQGSIVNQRNGLILSAGDMALSADRVENRSARIEALGDLDIDARVLLNANDHLQTEVIRSSGRIGSEGTTALRAQQDIEVDGGDVSAKDLLVLDAGRDIKVASTNAESTDGRAVVLDRVARLHVSDEAGELIARAGRDIELKAAVAQAGVVDVHAERDLRLTTLNTREALDATRDAKNYGRVQRSAEVGSAIGGNEVNLSAGRDVQLRAAQVQASGALDANAPYYESQNNGRLNIHAGRHLDITAVEASYQVEHGVYAKSSDALGSSSIETRSLDSRRRVGGCCRCVQRGHEQLPQPPGARAPDQ